MGAAKVSIPSEADGDVLDRVGKTASTLGKMPCRCDPTTDAYVEAHEALKQFVGLDNGGGCKPS